MSLSIASTLRPELATALKTLFAKLDPDESGSIQLNQLKESWNGNSQNSEQDPTHTAGLDTARVLESVEKFSVNGSLSYERLCCGIKLSLIDDFSYPSSVVAAENVIKPNGSSLVVTKSTTQDVSKLATNYDAENKTPANVKSNHPTYSTKEKSDSYQIGEIDLKILRNFNSKISADSNNDFYRRASERSALTIDKYQHSVLPKLSSDVVIKESESELRSESEVDGGDGVGRENSAKRDLFSVASKYNINFTPRCNSMQYESGYSTVKTVSPQELTSTPLLKGKLVNSNDATEELVNETPKNKSDKIADFLKLDLGTLALNDSKLSTQDEQLSNNKLNDFSSQEKTQPEIIRDKTFLGYEDLKFGASKVANGVLQNGSKKETEVSLYSVNDKSLLSQSMMDAFGYHPPREIEPVEIVVPPYALPSTLNAENEFEQLKFPSISDYRPKIEKQSSHFEIFEGYGDARLASESPNTETLNRDIYSSLVNGENENEILRDRNERSSQIRFAAPRDEIDDPSQSLYEGKTTKNESGFGGERSGELSAFSTEKLNGYSFGDVGSHSESFKSERAKSALSQTSTYSVLSASKSPIPPLSRTAYYELDENYDDVDDNAKASQDRTTIAKNDKDFAKAFDRSKFKSNFSENENKYDKFDQVPCDYSGLYKSNSRLTFEDTQEPEKLERIGVRETSNDVKTKIYTSGARGVYVEGYERNLDVKVNGGGYMNGGDHVERSPFASPFSNMSGRTLSEATKVRVKSHHKSAVDSETVDSDEKMDKMLDQALRAVNESYRLIRIGKKQLRNNSGSDHTSDRGGSTGMGGVGSLPGGSEKYLRLMNCVLDLHKSLLDLIDTQDESQVPADLADGEVSSDLNVSRNSRSSVKTVENGRRTEKA
ncbi:uncharacterized protein LOC142339665 isoform X2 [Convolutriloba macropyga]|uniref:uncharacterized protein LOC142339665 isoform X2 n=1 Tax=Convolutriloba macropyga TaxID=536237 RepID=UPI003F525AAC